MFVFIGEVIDLTILRSVEKREKGNIESKTWKIYKEVDLWEIEEYLYNQDVIRWYSINKKEHNICRIFLMGISEDENDDYEFIALSGKEPMDKEDIYMVMFL